MILHKLKPGQIVAIVGKTITISAVDVAIAAE